MNRQSSPPSAILQELQQIPGVGPHIARKLYFLGIRSVTDLAIQDPEHLYHQLCQLTGQHVDRCVLYVFRCAVYYASTPYANPLLLKWWHWKDVQNS